MRLGLLLLFWSLVGLVQAITSDVGLVHLGVSRSGLPADTTVKIKLFDDTGAMVSEGTGKFFEETPPGASARVRLKLNRAVNHERLREVGIELAMPSRSPVSVMHVAFALGPEYPRIYLVDQGLPRAWNGAYARHNVVAQDERTIRFDSFRVSGRVADSSQYSSFVEYWVELTNGKTYSFSSTSAELFGSSLHKTGPFSVTNPFPEPVYRGQIKRVRIFTSRSSTYRVTSFIDLFRTTDNIRLASVKFDGGRSGIYNVIADYALIDLSGMRMFQSADLSGNTQTKVATYRPNWYAAYVMTGDDDLRWDPNVQPNMEIVINMYVRGNPNPVRLVDRSLEPYAPFANGGVWGGSFAGFDIAERKARWRGEGTPPRIQDIEAIEVETIPGWDGSTPTRRIARGTGDPFRQPDTWAFRGIWVGASLELPSAAGRQALAPWHTVACSFERTHRLKVGQKVRFPVSIGDGLAFDAARYLTPTRTIPLRTP